jgi:predicted nucleic acid-binding protein
VTAFLDSNILIYAYSTDRRRGRAIEIVAAGGMISAQVLNEFTNVLRKKQKVEWPVIQAAVAAVRRQFVHIAPLTADTHAAGLALASQHGLAFYYALIVASAIEAGCDTLVTEDMQHDRRFGDLTVINPFIGVRQ